MYTIQYTCNKIGYIEQIIYPHQSPQVWLYQSLVIHIMKTLQALNSLQHYTEQNGWNGLDKSHMTNLLPRHVQFHQLSTELSIKFDIYIHNKMCIAYWSCDIQLLVARVTICISVLNIWLTSFVVRYLGYICKTNKNVLFPKFYHKI